MSTPAGWYPEPDRPGMLRWWDGGAWTDHVQPAAAEAAVAAPGTVAATTASPSALRDEVTALQAELETLQRDVVQTREVLALQEVGIYRYSHPLENALAYKARLDAIEEQIRAAVKSGNAVVGPNSGPSTARRRRAPRWLPTSAS